MYAHAHLSTHTNLENLGNYFEKYINYIFVLLAVPDDGANPEQLAASIESYILLKCCKLKRQTTSQTWRDLGRSAALSSLHSLTCH